MENLFLKLLGSVNGDLVQHFHLAREAAFTLVSLLSTGGAYYIAIAYPYFIPLVGTAQGVIAVFGTGVAVGW